MNRLRKPARASEPSATTPTQNAATTSRTMQLAVGGMKASISTRGEDWGSISANLQRKGTHGGYSTPAAAAPRTKVEQYWAARALVAETLLSVHDRHQAEVAQVRRTEEEKRERDMGAILRANDQRQRRLERLMVGMNSRSQVMCLAVFLGFVGWLMMKITPDRDAKNTGRPSHVTIPILSPFTSVVEHETGVFGTKAVVVFVMVVGIAAYVGLKRWSSQWRRG